MYKILSGLCIITVSFAISFGILERETTVVSAQSFISDPVPGGMCRCAGCNCFMETVDESALIEDATFDITAYLGELSEKQVAAATWTNNPVTNPNYTPAQSTITQDNSSNNTSSPRPPSQPSSNSNSSSGYTWTNNPVTNPGGSTITQDNSSNNTSSPRPPSQPSSNSNSSSGYTWTNNPVTNPGGSTVSQDNSSNTWTNNPVTRPANKNTSGKASAGKNGYTWTNNPVTNPGGTSSSNNTWTNNPVTNAGSKNSATGKIRGNYPYNSSKLNKGSASSARAKFLGSTNLGETLEALERRERRGRVRVADTELTAPEVTNTSFDPNPFGSPATFNFKDYRLSPDPKGWSTDRVGPGTGNQTPSEPEPSWEKPDDWSGPYFDRDISDRAYYRVEEGEQRGMLVDRDGRPVVEER
jgi:hypothetical protein